MHSLIPRSSPVVDSVQKKYCKAIIKHWLCGSPGNKTRHAAIVTVVYYARYLRLGMRYEAGICTIVISMNGAFQ